MIENTSTSHALETLHFDGLLAAISEHAHTDYGIRHVQSLYPKPYGGWLELEFDRIDELTGAVEREEELSFAGIRNLDDSLIKAELSGTFLPENELLKIASTAEAIERLHSHLKKHESSFAALELLREELTPLPELVRKVYAKIDKGNGELKDNASPKLQKLRSQIASLSYKTRGKLENLVHRYSEQGWLLDTGYTLREGRFVLSVLQPNKGKIHGIIHGTSGSGGTVYIEPNDLVEMGNEMRQLVSDEESEVRRILIELTDTVRENLDLLKWSLGAVGVLDSLQARAIFAGKVGAFRPEMSDSELKLFETRHPLLVLRKGLKDTVPLELKLVQNSAVLVITGPNAGGKTVALKTVGLITLMAHSAIFPSCGIGTVLPRIDAWHVIIGDDQSLEGDLSSFSGHLERLKEVLDDSARKKLVLIDEIAAGTDPAEGASLAMAFLDSAVENGWWTIITTHMGDLKAFAHDKAGIHNGSMQFDQEQLTPTYRFLPDLPGSSYALEIASRVGLPEALLDRAKEYAGEDRQRLEDLIEELSSTLTETEKQRRQLAIKQSEINAMEQRLLERVDLLEQEKSKLTGEAAAKAEELLKAANRAVEMAVKEIREKQASKEAIKNAHKMVEDQKQAVSALKSASTTKRKPVRKKTGASHPNKDKHPVKQMDEPVEIPGPFKVGDTVRTDGGSDGEILVLQGKKAQVAVGSMKIWLPQDQLIRIRSKKQEQTRVQLHVSAKTDDSPIPMELHLRGMRAEEAEAVLEKYIEDIAISGLPFARIVHGRGTGALKQMVRQILKNHPLVKSWRYGGDGEGGDGVTVINLDN